MEILPGQRQMVEVEEVSTDGLTWKDHMHHPNREDIGALGEDLRKLGPQETQTLADRNAALQEEGTDLVDDTGTLAHQALAHAMQRLQVELLGRLGRNELHGRALDGFGDRLGVAEVVLLPLGVRSNVFRRHEPGIVAKQMEPAAQVMGPDAGLHADQAGRHVREPRRVRTGDMRLVRARGGPGDYPPERQRRTARGTLDTNDRLLVFAGCIVLFQLANASVLPLVIEERGHASSLLTSVLVFIPQIVVAILAPWVGRSARSWGRRPLLLVGLGMLPIRAACFALTDDPMLLASVQMLDGISAAVIGVLTPLIIADLTKGTGLFNRGQGFVGTFSGIGAALSTTLSGYLAQNFGGAAAFYAIMGVALTAVIVCWSFMSETKDTPPVMEDNKRMGGEHNAVLEEENSSCSRGGTPALHP